MKIKYLRLIDKYAGVPLLTLLGIKEYFPKKKKSVEQEEIKRILIIKFLGFGSIILAFDFFRAIRKKYPKVYLCALTLQKNKQIYELSGIFDEIVGVKMNNVFSATIEMVRALFTLRKKSFDLSFDLEFTSRFSAIFSCLINAKRKIGFEYDEVWRGDCFSDTMPFKEDTKIWKTYSKLTRFIGVEEEEPSGVIPFRVEDKEKKIVDSLLEKEFLSDAGPLVGMNINASDLCLARRWPREYFVSLAEELIKTYAAHIVFIGSEDDFEYVASTTCLVRKEQRPFVHNFAGKVSLAQLAYLAGKFDLFISNDSGPLHLAAYLKIPTVSFFGPETPLIYGPEGRTNAVLFKSLECSPCIRIKNYKHADCDKDFCCLTGIKPADVLREIEQRNLLAKA